MSTPGTWALLSAGEVLIQGPFASCLGAALSLPASRKWVIVRNGKGKT